jgi:hypothetical protein
VSGRVVFEGLKEVIRSAKDGDRTLKVELRRAVGAAVAQGAIEAKQRAPYKSGALERSIEGRMVSGGEKMFVGFVEATAPHAAAIEEGAQPHPISAVNAPALRFKGKDGNWVSKATVNHPGNKPQPYMEPSVPVVEATLQDYAQQAVNKAISHF